MLSRVRLLLPALAAGALLSSLATGQTVLAGLYRIGNATNQLFLDATGAGPSGAVIAAAPSDRKVGQYWRVGVTTTGISITSVLYPAQFLEAYQVGLDWRLRLASGSSSAMQRWAVLGIARTALQSLASTKPLYLDVQSTPRLLSTPVQTRMQFRFEPLPNLHYAFDRGEGAAAVNYGSDQLDCSMVSNRSAWVAPGVRGASMLRGSTGPQDYAYCDTGRTLGIWYACTMGFWVKERSTPTTTPSYIFGGLGDFRGFTGGSAGDDFMIRGATTTPFDIVSPSVSGQSFQDLARRPDGVWVHVVFSNSTAQFYYDGVPAGNVINLPVLFDVASSGASFKIGKHQSNAQSSVYDIDEFRLYERPLVGREIWLDVDSVRAAVGSFGTRCGLRLTGVGGSPFVGNSRLEHTLVRSGSFSYILVVGERVRPTPGFDMGMLFPSLAGCLWYPSSDVILGGSGSNSVRISTRVPIDGAFAGLSFDVQALGLDPSGAVIQSNAVSHLAGG